MRRDKFTSMLDHFITNDIQLDVDRYLAPDLEAAGALTARAVALENVRRCYGSSTAQISDMVTQTQANIALTQCLPQSASRNFLDSTGVTKILIL